MTDLILIIGTELEGVWHWALSDNSSHGDAQSLDDKTALAALSYTDLHVVIPGMFVVSKLHALEELNDKYKRQAIGFSIEDDLAQPVDDVHIGLDQDTSRIAIVSNQYMQDLLASLSEFALVPNSIIADYDSVSAQRFCFEERLIESADTGMGYAIETALAGSFMEAGQTLPDNISAQEFLGKIIYARGENHNSINLRTGKFANTQAFTLQNFKRSALLAAACLAAFMVINLGQGFKYSKKTQQAKTEINQIFTRIFPDVKLPPKPIVKTLAARRERKGKTGATFILLSSILAKSLQDLEGVEVSSLRYNSEKAQLSLAITYQNFVDVETLKKIVAKNGGIFSEEGTRQNGSGITGNALIRLRS